MRMDFRHGVAISGAIASESFLSEVSEEERMAQQQSKKQTLF